MHNAGMVLIGAVVGGFVAAIYCSVVASGWRDDFQRVRAVLRAVVQNPDKRNMQIATSLLHELAFRDHLDEC